MPKSNNQKSKGSSKTSVGSTPLLSKPKGGKLNNSKKTLIANKSKVI